MSKNWYQHYPQGVSREISLNEGDSIASLLDQTCKSFEHKNALTCMGASVTFAQYSRLADHFAAYLQKVLGVEKGDRVAIMLPNVIQFPIAFYAVQKIGAICVNTNPLYTAREMRHQFKDSGAKVVVILDIFLDKLEEVLDDTMIEHVVSTKIGDQLPAWKSLLIASVMKAKGLVPSHGLKVTKFNDALKLGSAHKYVGPTFNLDDVAILQYTGGTTGVSKGAMLTQRNILSNVRQIQEWAKPFVSEGSETVLTALPLYHVFAMSVNFLSFFAQGGEMILVPKPIPIENTAKIFKKYDISVMTGVNTLYNALNNSEMFRINAPRGLKVALAGGMALQEKVDKEFQQITGVKVLEGFGLTEASPVTHCNPLGVATPPGSIGVPLPSTDALVVDEDGNEVSDGEVGELIVKGPQVMRGYWQRDEESAKCLKDGWLFTGDMARKDKDGFFFIVDRKKDMILVSGFNVYPNEVEDVLVSHPKVLEAAVIGIPDDKSGEKVKAFIVPKDGVDLSESEIRSYCEKELTGYKRPKLIEFTDELPKSNVGKVLRRHLRESA